MTIEEIAALEAEHQIATPTQWLKWAEYKVTFGNLAYLECIKDEFLSLEVTPDECQEAASDEFVHLAQNYKLGPLDLPSYCVAETTHALDHIIHKVKRNHRVISRKKPVDDIRDDELYKSEFYTNTRAKIERQDTVDYIRKHSDEINKWIIDLYLKDYTQQQIADKIGMSKMAVSKRIKKLKAALR